MHLFKSIELLGVIRFMQVINLQGISKYLYIPNHAVLKFPLDDVVVSLKLRFKFYWIRI